MVRPRCRGCHAKHRGRVDVGLLRGLQPLIYAGGDQLGGRFAEARARELGLPAMRAHVLGHVGSFRDGWLFRAELARRARCSVRTAQRAITQGKLEGLLGVARGGKNEIPPGARAPIPCGWSHRWTIGRELRGAAMLAAVQQAKAAALARRVARGEALRGVPHAPKPRRGMTPEQRAKIEALERDERAELEAMAEAAIAATEARARAGPGERQ
jgi:hypothetical protein